ncbi:MAG: peptidase M50 [Gemmataceae bacterium]|nr:peptidase M50 [Gemmataceae bacterium]
MAPAKPVPAMGGSIRLFRVAGISVQVHWSWLLVAYFSIQHRANEYDSQVWNVAEYLALFAIVLLHEFGHAFACRQTGGKSDRILLWPLGGIAFVQPPPRPGAVLWSIAAGPLVNVVLLPLTFAAAALSASQGLAETNKDFDHFIFEVFRINLMLLIFNMLPVYPLDGGQILQSLLWFVIGRAKSLHVVSVISLVVTVCVIGVALVFGEWFLVIMAIFLAMQAWAGFKQARLLGQFDQLPRHADAACPSCRAHPFEGEFWTCANCRASFDMFAQRGTCPACGQHYAATHCPECRELHSIQEWFSFSHR